MSYFKRVKISDYWGDEIGSTMIDQLMVAETNRLSGGVFNGSSLDTNFYTASLTANGTASVSNSILTLTTTTDSGSSAVVYTNSVGRYTGGNMNQLRTIFRFGDTGVSNNKKGIGVFNNSTMTDGFFFQLSGTTFQIVARTGGSDNAINSGSFNGDVTSWTVDTNFHTFEILYTNKKIDFYIDRVLIHSFTQTNSVIVNTRHLRPIIFNTNTGVGSVTNCYTQVMTVLRHGKATSQPKQYFQQGTTAGVLLKTGPGALHDLSISAVVNGATIVIYDGLSTAGTLKYSTGAMSAKTEPFSVPFDKEHGMPFENGLYAVISGANANCLFEYE